MRCSPPRDLDELRRRAFELVGHTLGTLASALEHSLGDDPLHAKGKIGDLVERALGATGGSHATHDFPDLAIELKTIPVDHDGAPHESTYVCTLPLANAERAEWDTSWVRAKLSHVLFVPVVAPRRAPVGERVIGRPVFFRPSEEQERVLRADFEDALGLVATGRVQELTAHVGHALQVRPKARDGSARTRAFDGDGEPIETMPRGFYLRPSFTREILRSRALDV